MITIEQLLESVDLDFEPRWVTKDEDGIVGIWEKEPTKTDSGYWCKSPSRIIYFSRLKLAEFENKPWQKCIYEVPRKTTGKIEKLMSDGGVHPDRHDFMYKINQIVDYVNALIESNNTHEKQIDKLQMKLEPEKCAVNELKGAKNEYFNLEKTNR